MHSLNPLMALCSSMLPTSFETRIFSEIISTEFFLIIFPNFNELSQHERMKKIAERSSGDVRNSVNKPMRK